MKKIYFLIIFILINRATFCVHKTTSVIIPCTYKHAEQLYELLGSLENQTVLPDEVIVSLSEAHKVDPSTKLALQKKWLFPCYFIESDKVQYAGENRNIGCMHATGDIFILQDADDIIHPQRIEIIRHFFEIYEIDHLMHRYTMLKGPSDPIHFPHFSNMTIIPHKYPHNFGTIWTNGIYTNGNIAIARHVFERVQWSNNLKRGQDSNFNRIVYSIFKNNIVLDISLLYYRAYFSSLFDVYEHPVYIYNSASTCPTPFESIWISSCIFSVFDKKNSCISTYDFNKTNLSCEKIQSIFSSAIPALKNLQCVTITPDKQWLVLCSGKKHSVITIYSINPVTGITDFRPVFYLKTNESIRAMAVTPSGKNFATLSNQALNLYQMYATETECRVSLINSYKNNHKEFVGKKIFFTHNNKFLISCFTEQLKNKQHKTIITATLLDSHKEIFGDVISSVKSNAIPEPIRSVILTHKNTKLALCTNRTNKIIFYPFNPETGIISSSETVIDNPDAMLNFPSSLALSPDEKNLLITNSNGNCNFYKIP